jgi:hypothetical protein
MLGLGGGGGREGVGEVRAEKTDEKENRYFFYYSKFQMSSLKETSELSPLTILRKEIYWKVLTDVFVSFVYKCTYCNCYLYI